MSSTAEATKPCPLCGEAILATARKCRYCGEYLDPSARPAPEIPGAAERMLIPVGRPASAIIAGYLGLFAVLIFPAPFALICGLWALYELKKKPHLAGRGRAWFGTIMGALGCALILFFVVMIAIESAGR